MTAPPDDLRCTATCSGGRRPETAGRRCAHYRMRGMKVCQVHGGRAPRARAKAAERLATADALKLLGVDYQPAPLDNPLEALRALAGRVLAWADVCEAQVRRLTDVGTVGEAGIEHTRASVQVFERALDRCARVLVDINKLDLDERLVRVREVETDMVIRVLAGSLVRCGYDPDLPVLHAAVAAEIEALAA